MRKELSTLIRDKEFWKRAGFSVVPGAVSGFVLNNRGDPDALFSGAYIWLLFVILSVSWHIVSAKLVTKAGFITMPGKDKPDEKEVFQYPKLRLVAIILSAVFIVVTLVLVFIPPYNVRATNLVYGTSTPTATITPSPTSTSTITFTPTSTFTFTPTLTPTPKEQAYYYLIVLDASAAMLKDDFDGLTRWDAAQNSLNVILEVLDNRSRYGLVMIGGEGTKEDSNPCASRINENISFTTKEQMQSQIRANSPRGGGSYSAAFNLAISKLQQLPSYTLKTLYFITGPSDTCETKDEWNDIETASAAISSDLSSNIIILDEKSGYKPVQFAKRMQELHDNVKVDVPTSNNALVRSSKKVVSRSITHISSYETAIAPTPITPTRTNTPTPSHTPANTYTVYPTDTRTPTKTATQTEIPTETPIISPPRWGSLPKQPDVFSPGCPLLSDARLYSFIYNGQARINADLLSGQHTDNGLSLSFSNAQEQWSSYAGWEVWLGPDDQHGIDLSSYNYLSFYVRGRDGGEITDVYLMMPEVGGLERFWKEIPVTTSWQQVSIPLSYFTTGTIDHQHVELNNILKIQIVFEWYPHPTSGTIYIDDLCVLP